MRIFNLKSTTAVVIANMIGTGVFTSLGYQLSGIKSFSSIIVLWAIGGISSLFGALAYAELTKSYPRSGGEYHFLGQIYHPILGFSAGFVSLFFGFAAPLALNSMAFGMYVQYFLPINPQTLALLVLWTVAVIHLISIRVTANFQFIATLLKIFLIIGFIFSGFFLTENPSFQTNFAQGSLNDELFSMSFAVALAYVFFSYSGWNAATYFTDEIKSAEKNVKLSLLYGVIIVSVLYILLNSVFLYAAPIGSMQGKAEVGHIAAQFIFGEQGGKTMSLLISLALISAISSLILAGPRVAKVIGEDYRRLSVLAFENKKGTPVWAISVQVLIATFFILSSSYESVLVYTGFLLNIFNLLTVAGVLVLHYKKEVFVKPIIRVFSILFLFIYGWATLYLFSAKFSQSLWGTLTILAGFLAYYILQRVQKTNS